MTHIQTLAADLFQALYTTRTPSIADAVRRQIREFLQRAKQHDRPRFQVHPFGFLKWTVGTFDCSGHQAVFRVHVWRKLLGPAAPTDIICHAHAWQLLSVILGGTLENQALQLEITKTKQPRFPLCTVRVTHDNMTLAEPTGEMAAIASRQSRTMGKLGLYRVPLGGFHNTILPTDEPVITLAVLYGRDDTSPAMSLHRTADTTPSAIDHRYLPDEAAAEIEQMIDQVF